MDNLKRNFTPFILLLGTGVLFWLTLTDSGYDVGGKPVHGKPYSDIQKTRAESIRTIELNNEQADLHNQVSPEVAKRVVNSRVERIDLEPERNLGGQDARDDSFKQNETLDQKMNAFIAHRQEFEAMENIKKVEYVKQFLKEARKMGYDVLINDDLEIVKVTKIAPQ